MAPTQPVRPRKQPRQARSRAMVAAIIEATTRVLRKHGYAGASTNRIAKLAGVSVGSLYQYFPGKDALVLAVADQHAAEMVSLLQASAIQSVGAPLPVTVRAFVRAMVQAHQGDGYLHRALIAQVMHLGMEQFQAVQRQATSVVRAFLDLQGDAVTVRDKDMAAWVLVTTVESLVHAALLEDPARLHSQAFEDEVVDLVVRYLTAGAAQTP